MRTKRLLLGAGARIADDVHQVPENTADRPLKLKVAWQ